MPVQTRKNSKKKRVINNKYTDAKKGTQTKCLMKTCRSKKYQAIFGSVGGKYRTNRQLFY